MVLEYRAVHGYKAQHETDVSFSTGDSVIVFETQDNGWWRGYTNNMEGWFPGSYVQVHQTKHLFIKTIVAVKTLIRGKRLKIFCIKLKVLKPLFNVQLAL